MTNLERVVQVGVLVWHTVISQLFLFVGQVLTYWGKHFIAFQNMDPMSALGATCGISTSQGSFSTKL